MKRCTKCGETKPLSEFNRDAGKKDGRYPYCKVCGRANAARWYSENQERVRANTARRYAEHREEQRAYYRARYARYKKLVHAALGWECAVCGTTENLEIDHIHGDGDEERTTCAPSRKGGRGGQCFYRWVHEPIDELRARLQLLCHEHHAEKTRRERSSELEHALVQDRDA